MTTSVVTGAAGFVGSHLAEKLLQMGHRVIGIDNLSTGRRENIEHLNHSDKLRFYEADIEDDDLMDKILSRYAPINYFFHLAAVVSVPFSVENPQITERINYMATVGLLEKCRGKNVTAFVQAGSAAEYGDEKRLPIKEEYATDKTRHLSPYGRTKFLATNAVSESSDPPGISLRFFNIFGPRQDPSSQYSGVISRFIEAALKGQPLTVFGDGNQTRDFIYVADVTDAYILAAGMNPASGATMNPLPGIYNVACSREVSINELAGIIKRLVGTDVPVVHDDPRPGDIRHSLANTNKIRDALGWKPRWSIEEGLEKTIEWYKKNLERTDPQ